DSTRITRMFLRLGMLRLLPGTGARRAGAADAPGVAKPPRHRLRDALRVVRELSATGTRAGELALAVGIGVFFGATPLWGLHAVLASWVAVRWRLNPAATFLATNVSFPPFAPVLAFAGVQAGHLLLHGAWLDLGRSDFTLAAIPSHL